MKSFHLILCSIGAFSIVPALYGWHFSEKIFDYYFGLFIGISLSGTAGLHQKGKIQ